MKRARRSLLVFLAALALSWPLEAADYVFVFDGNPTTNVYDAETVQVVATPALGADAIDAIGVPNPAQPGQLLKIYVLRSRSVLVLDPTPPFAIRATLPLLKDVTLGERSALLLPDGKKLLVVAEAFLHLFDVLNPANPGASAVDLGIPVSDFTVLPDSTFAYIVRPGLNEIGIVSLTVSPPQLLQGHVDLPAPPTAVAAAPNGRGIFASLEDQIFEVDPETTAVVAMFPAPAGEGLGVGFPLAAPLETGFVNLGSQLTFFSMPLREATQTVTTDETIREILPTNLDRLYLRAGTPSRFLKVVPSSGLISEIVNPVNADPFLLPAVDMEIDEGSNNLFLAFGALGTLLKLSGDSASLLGEVILPSPPTGIAVVSSLGTPPDKVEVYGGNHQFAAVGERLEKPLAARVLSEDGKPVIGRQVDFSSGQLGVVYLPPTAATNRHGVATTNVVVPVTTPFETTAAAGGATPAVFDVNAGVPGRDGIHIVSGNHQIASSNQLMPFPFVVEVVDEGVPATNLQLTVTPNNVNIICSVPPLTNALGQTSFTCNVPFTVTGTRRVERIQVGDPAGRVLADPFTVVLVSNPSDLPVLLRIFSPHVVTGVAGETIVNAIRYDAITLHGESLAGIGTQFVTAGDVAVDPPFMVTVPGGLTMVNLRFGCKPGPGLISVELNAANVAAETVTTNTVIGPPAQALKIAGNLQFGQEGEALEQMRIALRDSCNNPIAMANVTWEISPPGQATIERAARLTNPNGEAFAFIRLGTQPGPFQVIARSGPAVAIFTASVNAAASQMTILSGDGQVVTATQPATQPLVVELRNAAGQLLPAGAVEFEVVGGAGTVSPVIAQSNQAGQASTNLTAGGTAGPLSVVARSSGLTATFHFTVVGRVPAVPANGFVNGASFVSGWVPGSAGSIFGTDLMEGVTGVVNANTFPFPTTLRGVRVLVNGVPAPIIALANNNGAQQINIQVPFETPAPSTSIVVTIENNGTGKSFPGVETLRVQPGIFRLQQGAIGVAAALHLDSSIVTAANPAHPGETISLFLTGMGPVVPAVGTNVSGPVPPALTVEQPLVIIDGTMVAEIVGSAYAPGLATAYQINFVVPPKTLSGNRVIVVHAGGIHSVLLLIPIAPAPF